MKIGKMEGCLIRNLIIAVFKEALFGYYGTSHLIKTFNFLMIFYRDIRYQGIQGIQGYQVKSRYQAPHPKTCGFPHIFQEIFLLFAGFN